MEVTFINTSKAFHIFKQFNILKIQALVYLLSAIHYIDLLKKNPAESLKVKQVKVHTTKLLYIDNLH